MEAAVSRQVRRVLQPMLTNIDVDWGALSSLGLIRTPAKLESFYSGGISFYLFNIFSFCFMFPFIPSFRFASMMGCRASEETL